MVARGRPDAVPVRVRSLDALARRQLDAGGPWRAHSVFARACNLVAPDGALLGIVEVGAGNAPATLVLEDLMLGRPLDGLIAPGAPAVLHDGRLDIGLTLTLELAGAELWEPAAIRRAVAAGEIKRRMILAAQIGAREAPVGGLVSLLGEFGVRGRPADAVVERARALLVSLLAAIQAEQWTDVEAAARGLSGLGRGLTPAGDDLLAGLALGLRGAGCDLPDALAEALSCAIVGRTTDLAAARVRHAVAGHADERTHRVLAVLVMDTSAAGLPDAVRALLAYGHSSGADTLVGLLAGVGSRVMGHGKIRGNPLDP